MAEVDSGHRRILGPALLMGGTRALNIGVGLLLIPMMLRYLGPTAFAAWAIYSGGGMMLASLDFGIARILVKFLAHPLAEGAKSEVDAIAVNGLLITAAAYGITFVILLPVGGGNSNYALYHLCGSISSIRQASLFSATSAGRYINHLNDESLILSHCRWLTSVELDILSS